ncbi:enoyl-CoA hydratase [Croceicoccus estronivorus]|uniref:enoyl-CoA hydratase-related protein n=1 Tax=Croceicoccus estronivorus TaxID=1172626 RepID=UPI00082FA361|nr:enoyl-CoA hydratase-related protein [Croceicoccus estronivorus]OCC25621.1 enoyl-CoA hydratase [Croceicoccus estronivorus]
MSNPTLRAYENSTEGLSISASDRVLTIRLDREEKRNAITYDMYVAITQVLALAATDGDVSCVLFTGSGTTFSGGHDVGGFTRGLSIAPEEKPSFAFMQALSMFPKPVIAALNGNAVGIAATMLLHCDLVFAVPDCRLVFPFTKMGLIPEFASTHFLPRLIGHQRAMALFLTQGQCTAERAVEWGIINATVPAAEMLGVIAETTATISGLSLEAVMETKRLVKADGQAAVQDAIGDEARTFHRLLQSDFVLGKLAAGRGTADRQPARNA